MNSRVRAAILIFAFAVPSFAGDDGGSAGSDQCQRTSREYVQFSCRDGSRCDLDRTCDGWCTLAPVFRVSSRRAHVDGYDYKCYFDVRLSNGLVPVERASPVFGAMVFMRPSERLRRWLGATHVKVRCRPARKSCSPVPITAGVVVTGDYNAHFQAGAHARVFAADVPAGLPAAFHISLDDVVPALDGLHQYLSVRVDAPLAPGTYQPSSIDLRFRDGQVHYYSTTSTQCGWRTPCNDLGVFDGEVTVSTVEQTGTILPVVHGYVRGTFSHDLDYYRPETITLDASF
jgi:hypothetical protein